MRRGVVFIALVVLVCVDLCVVQTVAEERDTPVVRLHSFAKPFLKGHGSIRFWNFGGSTVVSDDYIRLTPSTPSRTGNIWNVAKVEAIDWEVTLEYKIHGGGRVGADGFAFWYAETPSTQGPAFGSKETWSGLMISFDTYDNDGKRNNPYVSIIMNDESKVYNPATDGQDIQTGGCQSFFRNTAKNPKARIRYEGEQQTLSVWMDTSHDDRWTQCVELHEIKLPTGYYFGLSATTGALADNHDVYSFQMRDLSPRKRAVEPQPPSQPEVVSIKAAEVSGASKLSFRELVDRAKLSLTEPVPTFPSAPKDIPEQLALEMLTTTFSLQFEHIDTLMSSLVAGQQNLNAASLPKSTLSNSLVALSKRLSTSAVPHQQAIDSLMKHVAEVEKTTSMITDKLHAQDATLTHIQSAAHHLSSATESLHNQISSTADTTVNKFFNSTSFGPWLTIMALQVAVLFGVFTWKKFQQDKATKLM